MGNETNFDSEAFEKRLKNLKDTQDAIQGCSAWCLINHVHHKKIVTAWLQVLKQVKVEHRLVLFYLANDVIQHSKRKNYDFVESWGTALQRATTMVRDDKVKHKILRIFKIWGDRSVYSDDFLADLNGLLSASLPKPKPKDADPDDFQIQAVVTSIRQCGKLQNETDRSLKSVNKLATPKLPPTFKDRSHCKEVVKQIDEDVRKHEKYVHNLKAEIRARTVLVEVLKQADEFYQTQRGEVKVVANAYKNFGNRIKSLKKKLDELTSQLPSPIPSPPANAPSPGPDADFELPNQFMGFSANGFVSSYMEGGTLPFDPMDFNRKSPQPHVNSIQVINSNAAAPDTLNPNNNLNDFFKTLLPPPDQYDPASSINFNDYSNTSFGGVPPPVPAYAPITMSNYGMSTGSAPGFVRNNYTGQPVVPPPPLPPIDGPSQNFNNWDPNWNSQERHGNPLLETPHSPPHYERKSANTAAPVEYNDMENSLEQAGSDVDHRSLTDILQSRVADIDHRNLISLTGSPRDNQNKNNKKDGDVDLRQTLLNLQNPPPPPSTDETKDGGDVDFRLPPPPISNLFPAGFNPLELPPALAQTSIGDIAKLLEGTSHDKNTSSEPQRKKQKGENGDDHFGSEDMEMSDEDEYQPGYKQDSNNGNVPPGFDTDHFNDGNNGGSEGDENTDDLNNDDQQWNQGNGNGNYSLIGQRLMQLANQDSNAPPSPSSNFIRPLMQMNTSRPPPPPQYFNQSPQGGSPGGGGQGFPGGSPMFRPRGRGGNRGSPFFRGGPSPRGFNNYRGNNFRGQQRGRW
ncbi:regulation of nuclear pre-mRNA domain-containing protein 2 isoform X2 [Culicoides brevitarsis]